MNHLELIKLGWEFRGKSYRLAPETVVGEAGKVTIIHARPALLGSAFADVVVGLSVPVKGKIKLGDQEITLLSPKKREIGLVPAGGALFPHRSVRGNIASGRLTEGWDDETEGEGLADGAVLHVAGRLGLRGFLAKRPHELPAGVRLNVALARAMCRRHVVRAIVIEDRTGCPPCHGLVSLALRSYRDLSVLLVTDDLDRVAALDCHAQGTAVNDAQS